ncbi:MAG TPA: S41 family peptidase [Gemmataceae bacterium]|nr:S41 family peptidase [Gemmataceae bacterium]
MAKVILRGWVGFLVIALVALCPVRAEEQKGHPCVVLVGISKYADEQILPRPYAEADIKALYDLLTNNDYLGIAPQHVRLLLGTKDPERPSELATHENILKALKWAAASAGKEDLVIVSLAMQGAPLGERSCYLATDSTFKDRAKNSLAAGEIESALDKIQSQKFCAFLDVNFKGFDPGKDPAPEANLSNFYREFLHSPKEDVTPPGRALFLATSGLKPSPTADGHGVFNKAVLDGLKGAADKEGYEPDGMVSVDELLDYLAKELPPLYRRYAKTKEEKEQRHVILGGRSSHFELTKNPAITAKVQDRLQQFKKLAAEKAVAKELLEEGNKLLSRMPKLEAQRTLRKRYQDLADRKITFDQFQTDRGKILDDMKLNRETAAAFAAKVIQASHLILKEYVKETNQGDLVASAVKGLYSRIDEKMPQEVKERLNKVKTLSEEDLTALLTDVRERLGKREDLAKHKDIDFALQRMMAPLDPYTTYIDPETIHQFKRETAGNFTGIGIQIRTDPIRDMLLVITPIKDSPAYKAGIKTGDLITQIKLEYDPKGNKLEQPEIISTKGLDISEAVRKIVGKPGTPVKITVEREGVDKPIEIELKRGLVEVESVLGVKRQSDDSWDYTIDTENQICYVRLTGFTRSTDRDLAAALKKLNKEPGIKGIVLDLRFNPGGLLSSAVNVSDLFIGDGLIVTIKPRVGDKQPYFGEFDGSYLNFPMVCLVNGFSASGSEIVSACLQDHKRAVIMGERSYGKGSVQNIQPFEEGEIKLTTASFWRPNGKNLNKMSTEGREDEDWGVSPDKGYTLKLSHKERDELESYFRQLEIIPRRDLPIKEPEKPAAKDSQLEMALKYLRGQIKLAGKGPAKKAG